MADVNANIGVNIDTSDALNQLKNLQRQISQFHQSVAKSSSTAAVAQRDLQKNFVNSVNAIQGFSAELRTVRSTAESFTNSLEKNKFSMREYFRYAAGATKTFGKNFGAEFSTIERTAIERVKTLQTQYIKMGRDAQGAMQAIAIRPTVLNMKDLGTQTAIAAQKQVLFNQLVKQGSTNLLNFGKNTQWAGRQLMVGFTLPLATLGMTAGRVFMDMEKAAIKFKKVYGDLFTAPEETQKAMDSITELGLAYTKYGVAVADSLSVAADAAAAGFQGVDLQNQTTASLKLSVLGQMELQKALETTIALQNAFRISSQDLNGTIDFLNAVENQTVVSLDDITEATPRVATVIQALGGDVKDLAFFLAAMKEGGVNAAQGANALKSGLASLINPTERASELLMGMGINIRGIVSQNQGDLRGTVIGFAKALDTLDPMNRAQAIEQLFGKFQFARISALFDNVIREGSQASRVLDLAGSSLSDLAMLSEKELGTQAASAMNKFTSAIERIKVALVPLGELFLNIATPFIDFGTKVLEAFNNLPDGMKKIIGTVITVVGGLGPVLLMTFGLINNGIANMIKFFATVRLGYLKMTGQAKGIGDETQYMTQEQLEAAAAAASLDQAHSNLTQRFTAEKTAVDALRIAYEQAAAAGARFAAINPGMMKPGFVAAPTKMAKGGVVSVGGSGNKDTEPALLTPGEAVIPAPMVKKYAPLIQGMIAGNIPGYAKGVMLGMPKSAKSVSKGREASEEIYQMFLKSSYANTAPTEYGHQISPTGGHSFPIFNLGGVYQKGNKQVFVKPVLDEKAAIAEMRSNQISRMAHGLEAPEQRIVVIRDPMDTTRTRRFLALESDLDPKFVNNQPMGVFNEEQYFRQLVASLLRVDKDLSGSNVFGNVVADAGPAGVFNRASGLRDYDNNLPSMEDQALINLLGIRGGAKRAFAESTLGMMAGLTPEQYRQKMLAEIQKVLPKLKQTIASFGLTDPTEVGVYDDMIRRLEQGLGVDWSKFHSIHSAVKLPKPKGPTQAIAGYKNGVVSVPGPKGAGDVTPAMLSPGEAVIPTEMAKKYAPLIQGMIAGNIPGYEDGRASVAGRGSVAFGGQSYDTRGGSEEGIANLINQLLRYGSSLEDVIKMLDGLKDSGDLTIKSLEETAKANDKIKTLDPSAKVATSLSHLNRTDPNKINMKTGEREAGSLVRRTLHSQNLELDTGQSSDKFSKEWKMVTGGLNESLKVGGLELTEGVKSAAQRMDDEIHDAALEMAQGGQVNAEIVEQATNMLIEKYRSANDELGQVARTMQSLRDDPKHKVILPPTKDTLLKAGISKEGERFEDTTRRLEQEKALTGSRVGKTTEYRVNPGFESLTTDPMGRFGYEEDGSFKNRPRRPATEAGATRSSTYLSQGASSMAAAGVDIQAKEISAAGAQLKKDAGVASPSRETIEASQGMVQGVTETIVGSKDDVARATEEMLSPVTGEKTIRRASSDPATQAEIDRRNQPVTQASQDSANIAAGAPRAPRRAYAPEGPATAPAPGQPGFIGPTMPNVGETATNTKLSLDKTMNTLSTLSIAMSSVTGILYMFGGEMQGVAGAISMFSAGLFGLIQLVKTYQQLQITSLAIAKFQDIAEKVKLATTVAAAAGTGFFGTMVAVSGAILAAFNSPLLIIIAVLALVVGGFMAINHVISESNKQIQGLGAAASLSEEKLNFLAEKFNVTAKSINWADRTAAAAASAGKSTEEKEQVVDLMIDPEFAKEFDTEITGIKNATKQEAELALQSLATQLRNSGFEDDAISAIISAIAAKAGQTELDLNFKPIFIADESSANAAAALAKEAVTAFNNELAAVGTGATQDGMKEETLAAAGVAKASLDSLTLAFESGNISAEIYNQSLSNLFNTLNSAEQPAWMLDSLAEKMGLEDVVKGFTNATDKSLALQAAVAGIDVESQDFKDIEDANKAGNQDDEEIQRKAVAARRRVTSAITAQTKAQEEQNAATRLGNILEEDSIEAESIQASIDAYHALVNAGMDAELAYQLTGDAAQVAALKAAMATDAINGNTAAVDAFKLSAENLDSLQKEREALNPKGGGGGQKSAFQEAMDQLKEQQKAAKDSITTYAGLRSSGIGVAEAFEIAGDSMLSAALASQKVGSAGWNQLITAIRAARAEEAAWLNSTPEGRAEHFADVYGKVMDVFSAQEAILEMNNESATAANRKIIETLEKQIEAYERRTSELQRDLDKIAEKEDEINKAYDEKTKALETVKKLNQDIINQQKSQLSIAEALSKGDISAAASAMQDARAQGASTQGDAVGRALDAARESELNGLTQNGKTRKQIETEIEKIKKNISAIEFGALQNARDAVEAADEALETAKENLRVQGQSRTEWENINTRIDASKANAALYDAEVAKALENAKGLVGEWSKLQDTFTTTHVVNTVTTTNGVATTNTNTNPNAPLTKDQWITKLQSEITELRRDFTRAEAAGRPSGGIATQIRNKESDLARIKASPNFAAGGYISGPGTATSDSIPAMLSDGEYVIKAAAVNKFGKGFLDAINAGRLPGFKLGGMLRDGGGSSKPTPPKTPINLRAVERAATTSRPRVTQTSSTDMVGEGMKLAMDEIYKATLGSGISTLARSGNASKMTPLDWAGLATIGLGTGMFNSARTIARTAKRIRGLQPDVPKVEPKLPNFSTIGAKLPAGIRALIDDMTMIHRSENPSLVTKHPSDVAVYQGNTQGPGTYFYGSRKESLDKGWQYGGYTYQQKHSPLSALKTAGSKGYLDWMDATFKMNAFVSGKRYDSEVVQDLIKQGYIGMKDPNTGIMTNWLTGTKGGPTLKKVGQQSGMLERLASMFNSGANFAKGGLATNKFAMGGLVSPKYFAMGGLVSPKYFANGGMAKGTDTVPSMLTPGEFVVNKKATDMYGPLLAAMNSSPASNLSMMGSKTFSAPVYNMPSREYAGLGGNVGIYSSSNNSPSLTALDNSVYNYSLSVNVEGTNASANDIANVVMNKIKTIDSQQVRRQVLR